MSQKKINITPEVMDKIRGGSVTMKPRIYFIAGSLLVFAGLIASFIVSVFLIALTQFSLRTHGPMGQYRLSQILSSFPWWAPFVAIGGIVACVFMLRKYDFSYKKNFVLIVAGFVIAVVVAGWAIDYFGLDNIWFRQGPMRGVMRQYMQNNGFRPGIMRRGGGIMMQ